MEIESQRNLMCAAIERAQYLADSIDSKGSKEVEHYLIETHTEEHIISKGVV